MRQRISKNDVKFMAVLVALVIVVLGVFYVVMQKDPGTQVIVTVDGEEYGRYSLDEEQEIPIVIDGVTTNLLVIKDGVADMTEANCPDKLCVHQREISKSNEMIVCLPNKVVVEISGGEESGFDTIAK